MTDESPSGPTGPAHPQRILLVTGVLGAGKTTAMRALEDLGWEAIDNFPIRLLERLLETAPATARLDQEARNSAPVSEQQACANKNLEWDGAASPGHATGDTGTPLAIGFDTRTRGFDPNAIIERVKKLSLRQDLSITTLFLDCSTAELQRRYNETRRPHPMSDDRPAESGIVAERELLEPLRRWADVVVTTTNFTSNDLQQTIREHFRQSTPSRSVISVISFGFSRGTPPLADLVFDMRFLSNPHWVETLRPQTGRDPAVGDYIRRDPAFPEAFGRIRDLLLFLLPRYAEQGKAYVNIAFGCTGGKHRSVFMAEQIAASLREAGFSLTLLHRNLGSRPADLVERSGIRDMH